MHATYNYSDYELPEQLYEMEDDYNETFSSFVDYYNVKFKNKLKWLRINNKVLDFRMIMYILIYTNETSNIKMRKDTMKRLISLLKPFIDQFYDIEDEIDINLPFSFPKEEIPDSYNDLIEDGNYKIDENIQNKFEEIYFKLIDKYSKLVDKDEDEIINELKFIWSNTAGYETLESPITFKNMINILTQKLVEDILIDLFEDSSKIETITPEQLDDLFEAFLKPHPNFKLE
jgi:hypothetical protein